MVLTEIISKKSEISTGTAQFFIASEDFEFEGLPILKDSLVYYDGNSSVRVNMINFGIFQNGLISANLPKNGINYQVDRLTSCELEIDELGGGDKGIWHKDHFDYWQGDFDEYIARINNIPILEYSEISFSSLMYHFNPLTRTLVDFINVLPLKIELNQSSILLPANLYCISYPFTLYFPVNKTIKYFNVSLKSYLTLKDTGVLQGANAEQFSAQILGHSKLKTIHISKETLLYISSDGKIEIDLFNANTNKVEKFQIVKSEDEGEQSAKTWMGRLWSSLMGD